MKVNEIKFSKRNIHIVWETAGQKYDSMLYCHSDYSWHWDSATRAMTPKMVADLQNSVMAAIIAKTSGKQKRRGRGDQERIRTWFADRQ